MSEKMNGLKLGMSPTTIEYAKPHVPSEIQADTLFISDESIGMTVAEESSPSSILTDSEATPTPMPEIAPPEYATPTATNSMSFDEGVDG